MVTVVPDHFDFPLEEEKIIELWRRLDAFQTCLKQSKDRPKYTFYDGPPFATGLPHYGHILAGTIKVRVIGGGVGQIKGLCGRMLIFKLTLTYVWLNCQAAKVNLDCG